MQLFVVQNAKQGQTWVFDNHDAALRCRQEQKLSSWALTGCVVFDDWVDGKPTRINSSGCSLVSQN